MSESRGAIRGAAGMGSIDGQFLLMTHTIASGIGGTASRNRAISAANPASIKMANTPAITSARFIHDCWDLTPSTAARFRAAQGNRFTSSAEVAFHDIDCPTEAA